MKEWKVRQAIYHKLNNEHDDDLSNFKVEITDTHVQDAVRYFTSTDIGWVYPAKSYVVAICYARWLLEYFGEDFYEALNDPDLLYGNDPYFVPYEEDKDTYNKILDIVGFSFDDTVGVIPDIKQYFIEEFQING